MSTLIAHCPICGLPFGELVDIVELQSSYWICECCGCEYGLDDTWRYREAWLERGAPWFDSAYRPLDWDLDEQLLHIIVNWCRGWRPAFETVRGLLPLPASAPTTRAFRASEAFHDKLEDGSDGPTMVAIPTGRFKMGSPSSERGRCPVEHRHEIHVGNFAIGRYAVTFEEYDRFCAATGRAKPSDGDEGRGKQPVIDVSWHDALAYADWLSAQTGQTYRLPTEAEWEYACRGGVEGERYSGGNDADRVAWHFENSDYRSHPVGEKAANSFGLHDMSGNVNEWTCSLYEYHYNGTEALCIERDSGDSISVRGGCCFSRPEDVRSASRHASAPTDRSDCLGFRLARSL